MPEHKILAIIVMFNGRKWIQNCFGSLQSSSVPLKIVAIDNGSTDGTIETLKADFPQLKLLENTQNLGFGKANNIGLELALKENADYVLLLNQDAWIEPATVERLVAVHQANPGYGVLSPIHLSGAGDTLDQKFNAFLRREQGTDLLNDVLIRNGELKEVYPFTFINAAAWLVSRECLERVGGFDPIFPHYGEDNDFLNRCFYHGLKLGVVPGARIWHDRDNQVKLIDEKLSVDNLYISFLKELKALDGNFEARYKAFRRTTLKRILWMLFSGKRPAAAIYLKTLKKVDRNKAHIAKSILASIHGRAFI